jgi:hypothetical protein
MVGMRGWLVAGGVSDWLGIVSSVRLPRAECSALWSYDHQTEWFLGQALGWGRAS